MYIIEKKRKAYCRRRRHTAVYLKKKKNSTKAVRTVDCIRWLFADESVLVVVEYCANQLLWWHKKGIHTEIVGISLSRAHALRAARRPHYISLHVCVWAVCVVMANTHVFTR